MWHSGSLSPVILVKTSQFENIGQSSSIQNSHLLVIIIKMLSLKVHPWSWRINFSQKLQVHLLVFSRAFNHILLSHTWTFVDMTTGGCILGGACLCSRMVFGVGCDEDHEMRLKVVKKLVSGLWPDRYWIFDLVLKWTMTGGFWEFFLFNQ